MEVYECLIIGSGFRSLGIAESIENALIVESSFFADPVHYGTLSGFKLNPCRVFHEKSRSLRELLESFDAVNEGAVDSSALEACLSEYIKSRGIKVLLGTSVIEIIKQSDHYKASLITSAGEISVSARHVITTRGTAVDSLRFLMNGNPAELELASLAPFSAEVSEAFHSGEFVLSLKNDANTDMPYLMTRALDAIANAIKGTSVKIVTVAPLAYNSDDPIYSADPISEFGRGVLEGEALK